MATKVKALPLFDVTKPVTFLCSIDRLSKTDVPGKDAPFEREGYALSGLPVTCWQGGLRVGVPFPLRSQVPRQA